MAPRGHVEDGGEMSEDARTGLVEWMRRRRRPLGAVGAVIAAGMSALWVVVVPDRVDTVTGVQEVVIRWGHPVCWALLAIVGILVAVAAPKRIRDVVAVLAAGSYAAFVIAMLWP